MDKQLKDFNIHLQHIETLAPKINQGIQIILVINGELHVETNSRYYHLAAEDLLIINHNQLFQAAGSNDNRTLMITISDSFMSNYYEAYHNSRFDCFSREIDLGKESIIHALLKLIAETAIAHFRKNEGYKIEIQSHISEILLILIRRFRTESKSIQRVDSEDKQIQQIHSFMEENYDRPITLDDIADHFYLSPGYLSRYFKEKTGIGFKRFLMNIRMEHALKELLYTPYSISQIAINNGFPNTKSFTSLFKETYKMTPTEYRERHQVERKDKVTYYEQDVEFNIISFQNILGKLGIYMENTNKRFNSTETRMERVKIDINGPIIDDPIIYRPKHNLSIGELREILKDSVRTQILTAKKDLHLEYIAVRNLIHGTTIIPEVETDEIIATTSPYFDLDYTLNFLRQNDLSLFVRVDYREITRDEDQFFTKLRDLIAHCLNLYGNSFVETWYFMFYEPYHTGVSPNELKRVYTTLYRNLKNIIPSINVGTFIPYSYQTEKLSKQHVWMLERDTKIDFFAYEANQNEIIDFEELGDNRFSLEKDYIKNKTLKIKSYLRKHKKDRPIHMVSWNVLSGNTRHTNGTFFRGALIMKSALDVARDVESMGFWINTHQHEKLGKNRKIRLEGMELYHYFSGKRPAFFAMHFLERLQGELIAVGEEFVLAKNERGYQLILMNPNNVNPYYSIEETLMNKLNKEININIAGMEPGEYQVRKRVFDKEHGALYTKWWELNSKYGMDEEVIDYIVNTNQPSLELFDETIGDEGTLSLYSYLTNNAIHFYDIRRTWN